jgi:hypothetical protein
MSEVSKGFAPEYGSKEYYDIQQEQHDSEERTFVDAGWGAFDLARPFYNNPATSPEGTTVTVADTVTKSPGSGFEWFKIDGDVVPPEGMWNGRSVMVVKDGKWETVKHEKADE